MTVWDKFKNTIADTGHRNENGSVTRKGEFDLKLEKNKAPAEVGHDQSEGSNLSVPPGNKPTARAQYLCEHLHAAGPRPTYEAMKEVAAGEDLDEVLERYGRIPSSFYRILGASSFFKPMIVWASTCLSRKK